MAAVNTVRSHAGVRRQVVVVFSAVRKSIKQDTATAQQITTRKSTVRGSIRALARDVDKLMEASVNPRRVVGGGSRRLASPI
jgi:hypothetical protein